MRRAIFNSCGRGLYKRTIRALKIYLLHPTSINGHLLSMSGKDSPKGDFEDFSSEDQDEIQLVMAPRHAGRTRSQAWAAK